MCQQQKKREPIDPFLRKDSSVLDDHLSLSFRVLRNRSDSVQRLFSNPPASKTWVNVLAVLLFLSLIFLPFCINYAIASSRGHNDIHRISGRWISELRDVLPAYDELLASTKASTSLSTQDPIRGFSEGRKCVQNWTALLQNQLRQHQKNATEYDTLKAIFSKMVGATWLPAWHRLESVMADGADLSQFVRRVGECAQDNMFLGLIACSAWNDTELGSGHDYLGDEAFASSVFEVVSYMLLTEKLTEVAVHDAPFAELLVDHLEKHYEDNALGEHGIYGSGSDDDREFARDKYESVKAVNALAVSDRKRKFSDAEVVEASVQLNIAEAALLDLRRGRVDNGMVGLALATHLDGLGAFATISDDEDRRVAVALGKEWVDLYIAWNFAFVAALPTRARMGLRLSKLLLPSVQGRPNQPAGAGFLYARTVSLLLDLVYEGWDDIEGKLPDPPAMTKAAAAWGRELVSHLPWELASKGEVSGLGDSLRGVFRPRELSLFSAVDQADLTLVSTLSLLAAVLVAACALEAAMCGVVWGRVEAEAAAALAWTTELTYSLFLCIALYAQSTWGLPFMVVGLWRLGYPELLASVLGALTSSKPPAERFFLLLRAVSVALHHAAAAFVICALCTGYSTLNRDMLAVILPLSYLHLAAVVRYHTLWGWRVACVVLEGWWQVEGAAFLASGQPTHEQVALVMLLLSHYGYMVVHGTQLVRDCIACWRVSQPSTHGDSSVQGEVCYVV